MAAQAKVRLFAGSQRHAALDQDHVRIAVVLESKEQCAMGGVN